MTWGAIDRIMQRAVERGLARRDRQLPSRLCVDETPFQKRHEYVTVVTDPDCRAGAPRRRRSQDRESGSLLHRTGRCAKGWHPGRLDGHVGALGDAVDKVCRQEHSRLTSEGSALLKGSKYAWLSRPENMTHGQRRHILSLRDSTLKT